jgi:alkylation response protein AidB-like acyl-CoA dehydrogenase
VDFELSDDQVGLTEGVRSFCQGRFPMGVVRALADTGGVDPQRWRELADLGAFSLRLPEAEGGVGLGWADAVLVCEELGRALVPGPVVWTHLAAGLVDGAATGGTVVTGVELPDASGLLEHGGVADVVLVVDPERGEVRQVAVAELDLEPVGAPLDPLTPLSRLRAALPSGDVVGDAELAARLRLGGAALTAGYLLGVAEAACDLAVAYAKDRVQFDRPIGQFQAIKHLAADMLVRVEVARAAAYAAGVTLDDPGVGPVERAVGSAKLTAAEAACGNAKTCVQIHGGMGFTWEVDAHLFFKRAYALEPAFGSREEWAERIADLLAA